ncbi:MAG TPA: hypothetical protein VFB50_21885 [Chloroflexota bacterium]|nr:hypothetical protein [Chloroflexota bacterium]
MLAALLFAQALLLPHAYTLADPVYVGVGLQAQLPALDLVTAQGVFVIGLGAGCDGITEGQNVEVLYGSGDVGSISLLSSPDQRCQIVFGSTVSDAPCATNADGECDIAALE